MKRTLLAAFFSTSILLTTPQVQAQLVYEWSDTYFIDAAVNANIERNKQYLEELRRENKSSTSNKSAPKARQTVAKQNVHKYKHSDSTTHEVNEAMFAALAQQLKNKGSYNDQSEQQLTALKNANLIKQVRQALESDGYDTTSIATATAYAITISYGIANNLDLSQLKAHGLLHQLQEVMEEDSTMQSLSNTDKQKMADTLYWIGSLEMAMYMEAQKNGDSQALGIIANDARSILSMLGVSGDQITQGSNGLEIR